jgi:erythritol transport system permease protein
VIVGVSAYWQMVFIGAVIVVAVLLNSLQYGRRRRTTTPSGSSDTKDTKDNKDNTPTTASVQNVGPEGDRTS